VVTRQQEALSVENRVLLPAGFVFACCIDQCVLDPWKSKQIIREMSRFVINIRQTPASGGTGNRQGNAGSSDFSRELITTA
jgi:hypothetical protein